MNTSVRRWNTTSDPYRRHSGRPARLPIQPREEPHGCETAELAEFLRNRPPPPWNYMSYPDGRSLSSSLSSSGDGKSDYCLRASRLLRRRRRSSPPPTIRLPDTAVAGTTTGGRRHIAISIPIEHTPFASRPRSQYPVYLPEGMLTDIAMDLHTVPEEGPDDYTPTDPGRLGYNDTDNNNNKNNDDDDDDDDEYRDDYGDGDANNLVGLRPARRPESPPASVLGSPNSVRECFSVPPTPVQTPRPRPLSMHAFITESTRSDPMASPSSAADIAHNPAPRSHLRSTMPSSPRPLSLTGMASARRSRHSREISAASSSPSPAGTADRPRSYPGARRDGEAAKTREEKADETKRRHVNAARRKHLSEPIPMPTPASPVAAEDPSSPLTPAPIRRSPLSRMPVRTAAGTDKDPVSPSASYRSPGRTAPTSSILTSPASQLSPRHSSSAGAAVAAKVVDTGAIPLDRVSISRRKERAARRNREQHGRDSTPPSPLLDVNLSTYSSLGSFLPDDPKKEESFSGRPVSATAAAAAAANDWDEQFEVLREARMRDAEARIRRLERTEDIWLLALVPVLEGLSRTLSLLEERMGRADGAEEQPRTREESGHEHRHTDALERQFSLLRREMRSRQENRRHSTFGEIHYSPSPSPEAARATHPASRRFSLDSSLGSSVSGADIEPGHPRADAGARASLTSGLETIEPLMRELQGGSDPTMLAGGEERRSMEEEREEGTEDPFALF